MARYEKTAKMYECLDTFYNDCSDEKKEFISLLYPMIYQENNNRLEITVGKDKGDGYLQSFLATVIDSYIIKLSCIDNEPIIIIYDYKKHKNVTMVNLTQMRDIKIIKTNNENGDLVCFDIMFNYCSQIDYFCSFYLK